MARKRPIGRDKQLIALFNKGKDPLYIAKEAGLTRSRVYQILKEHRLSPTGGDK